MSVFVLQDGMASSSNTEVTDTLDPLTIVSNDEIMTESEVHTSDTTSTDKDDFQLFSLPGAAAELADGPLAGDLPLVEIPAPIPLAIYPAYDILLDADADDDVDLFDDELLEDDIEGEALLADGGLLLLDRKSTRLNSSH